MSTVGLRDLLAGPWLAARKLRRQVFPPAHQPGAFRILLFHGIAPDIRDVFSDLVAYLAETRGFIDPAEAARRLTEGDDDAAGSEPPVLLSFDDGFASNLEIARSVLAEHGIKALFFVCPGLVDLAGKAQRDAVLRQVFRGHAPDAGVEPLMGWDDLAALAAEGHRIGAHGLTHARLASLDADKLEGEVSGAHAALAARLGEAPDWFAYPFGDIASIDAAALAVIGRHFRFCRSGVRGGNGGGSDGLAMFADQVDLGRSAAWQRLIIDGGLDGKYATARARLAGMAVTARHSAAP